MPKQKTEFKWTAQRDQAAVYVADDYLTDEMIGVKLKIDRRTLTNWKQETEFQARVADLRAEYREAAERQGIALVENRLRRYDRDWRRLEEIKEARAEEGLAARETFDALRRAAIERGETAEQIHALSQEAGWPATFSGMETGLLVRTVKYQGRSTVEEVAVDTGLLAEQRAIEQQAAKELGQWLERSDLTSGGKSLQSALALEELTDDELDRRLAQAQRGAAETAVPG